MTITRCEGSKYNECITIKVKINKKKREEVINLFRKTITSLSCIEKTTIDENLKNEANEYLIDLINQYKKIIELSNIKKIKFKYTEED